jgi:3-dehydroquinate synthase class II
VGEENGWNEWKNVIKIHMESQVIATEHIKDDIAKIKIELGKLQVKSGVWGFLAGAIPTVGMLLFMFIKEKF